MQAPARHLATSAGVDRASGRGHWMSGEHTQVTTAQSRRSAVKARTETTRGVPGQHVQHPEKSLTRQSLSVPQSPAAVGVVHTPVAGS
jgi:hypothetical protein